MNFEYILLKDFYDCCNVPIKLISAEFEDICKVGYTDYFDRIYPFDKINLEIKKMKIK